MLFRYFFLIVPVVFLLVSCKKTENYLQEFSTQELEFFETQDPQAQKETFDKSHIVYKGSPICSRVKKCRDICKSLFALKSVQDHCYKLPLQQIIQINKLYESLTHEDFVELQNTNVFDLKVLFSLSSARLFGFFKTLDSVSVKKFLLWIVKNWQVAFIFQQEDPHFLFLEIFLNKLNQSPINSLEEKLEDNRTFMELAWLRNNDHVLFWLDDYFNQKVCEGEPDLKSCVLSQYCLISQSFEPKVQLEFGHFNRLKDLLKTEDLQSFCLN